MMRNNHRNVDDDTNERNMTAQNAEFLPPPPPPPPSQKQLQQEQQNSQSGLEEIDQSSSTATSSKESSSWSSVTDPNLAKLSQPTASTSHPSSQPGQSLSKNEFRRRERRERKRQLKLEKKHKIKQAKMQQANQQGRDWESEYEATQRFVEQRTQSGDRKRRLDVLWKEKLTKASSTFRICIDCSYESPSSLSSSSLSTGKNTEVVNRITMNERELASLAQQIRYCYSYNKKNTPYPHLVAVTGLRRSITNTDTRVSSDPDGCCDGHVHSSTVPSTSCCLLDLLRKEVGYEQWEHRGFTCTTRQLDHYYTDTDTDEDDDDACSNEKEMNDPENQSDAADKGEKRTDTTMKMTTSSVRPKLVYLTSDASTILRELDDDKVYIIGGIVDRNRLKRAAVDRAESLGIVTAKLPLDEFYDSHPEYKIKGATKVLAVNHVFDILLRVHRYGGKDWDRAFEEVLPLRKQQKASS